VNLRFLYLYENELTGQIPPELGVLVQLLDITVQSNIFTGALPHELSSLVHLQHLYLQDNMLTGPLLPKIGDLRDLQELFLFNNYFSQQLPTELSQLTSLRVLRLQNNLLSGPLDGVFTANMTLENVDLSGNKFSGEIPSGIFDLPAAISIALSLNCFEGSLTGSMCNARNVSVLSMDGLGAAKDCKNSVQIPLSGVTLFNTLDGTIPTCVWLLPMLQVLHLTGNGLTGSIGEAAVIGSLLKTISLGRYVYKLCNIYLV
jgi:hypothetical protein